jgi:hypothetical protein
MTGNPVIDRRFSEVRVTSVANLKFSERGNKSVGAGFARKVSFNSSLAEKLFVIVDVAEEFPFLVTKILPPPLRSKSLNERR